MSVMFLRWSPVVFPTKACSTCNPVHRIVTVISNGERVSAHVDKINSATLNFVTEHKHP